MKKFALFVFNGDPVCFVHVLLNALDMKEKGHKAKIIVEGAAVKLVPELIKTDNPLRGLWEKAKKAGLVHGVCKACASKMGTLASAEEQSLALLDDVSGHPGMAAFSENGYEIITF